MNDPGVRLSLITPLGLASRRPQDEQRVLLDMRKTLVGSMVATV